MVEARVGSTWFKKKCMSAIGIRNLGKGVVSSHFNLCLMYFVIC